jgi:hypothetical protein
MPFFTTALALGGLAAAGSLGGAAIASNAAGNAADTQSNAANYAANLQKQESDNALNFQKQEWQTQQANMAPWLQEGQGALSQLKGLTSTPGQGLLEGFKPPTLEEAKNYPGYQFGLQQGEGAIQNAAAAKGGLESGNTMEALNNYAQNSAQQDYSNVYNQSFNTFETNQANQFNRLASLSGLGQTTANQLGQQGQAAANNMGNIFLTTGAQQGQDAQSAAAAQASGYVGGANAWSGALGGSSNSLAQMMMMQQLFGQSGTAPTTQAALQGLGA